jgi:hypothetical protein
MNGLIKRIASALIPILLTGVSVTPAWSDEPKNRDFDVIRDEAAVPPYQLPPILVTAEGKAVTTAEEWFNVRRPQIMALFGNLIYGVVPQPESPAPPADAPTVKARARLGEDWSALVSMP